MRQSREAAVGVGRREAIGLTAAAMLVAGSGSGGASAAEAASQSLSPRQALERLLAGNARYVGRRMTSFGEDLDLLRRGTAEAQAPYAAVLSCADSRVPVELIFDETIGRLFVVRVAGVVASPETMASLEYGAAVLNTRVILVLAHQNCGAVKAAITAKAVPGQISVLYRPLRAAVDRGGGELETASKANASIQAELLAAASPVLSGLIKSGDLLIAPAYYELGSGRVTLLTA